MFQTIKDNRVFEIFFEEEEMPRAARQFLGLILIDNRVAFIYEKLLNQED